ERGGAGGGAAVILSVDLGLHFDGAQGEQSLLVGAKTVETPGAIDDGLDELALDSGLGLEIVEEVAGEFVMRLAVIGRDDDGLAGEAVAQSVEAGALLALRGARAGGMILHGSPFRGAGAPLD